jgi:hypothetical protein
MDEQRSRETRARAETALVRLLHALGDEEVFLVVLGGLVPEVLAILCGAGPVTLRKSDLYGVRTAPDASMSW